MILITRMGISRCVWLVFYQPHLFITDFVVKRVHSRIFLSNVYRIEYRCVESYCVSNDNDWQFHYEIEPVDVHQVQRHQEHLAEVSDEFNDVSQHVFTNFSNQIS